MPASPNRERLSPAAVDRDLEVIATLGEGGMGRVLLARQHSLDREVAIKTLHGSASDRERDALLLEGAITGHLEHPTIIPVHALGLDSEGRPVLVMKRVEGVEWTRLLEDPHHEVWGDDQRERLAGHLDILMQVCNAVHFAHGKKVVHRDIKPQNVLIGRYGDVYLGDWGLAVRIDRDWQPQPLCGTPAYMAPEMVVGGAVDERTDVYLLGATLHQILTGQPRNAAVSVRDALLGAVDSAPLDYPPSVPEELGRLANQATSRDPAARPPSALAFRQALVDYLHHKSSIALAQSAAERLAELERLIHDGLLDSDQTLKAIDRLSVEARFALDQALAQWRKNPLAERTLAQLEAHLASRRARAAELERLAIEHDRTKAGPIRAMAFAAVALVGAGLSLFAIVTRQDDVTPRALFFQSLGPLGVFGCGALILRRRLFASAFNRRLVLGCAAVLLGITLSRAYGVYAGLSAPNILVYDLLLATLITGLCAAFLFRWVVWSALGFAAGMLAAIFWPSQAMVAFSAVTGIGLILNAYFVWTRGIAGK